MTRARMRWVERAAPWIVLAVIALVWELACAILKIPAVVVPRPSQIAASLVQYRDPIMEHAFQTLLTTIVGFGLAVVAGLVLGVLIGASSLFYAAVYGLLIGLNAVPKVALIPLFVVWFGIGFIPAVLTAFLLSFFPVVVNVATGIAMIEPEMRDVLRSLRARRYQIIMKIGLPRSLPYFFASLKIAITLAFVGSITSETIASDKGIGYLMISASSQFNVALVFAGVTVVGALGVLLYWLFALVERRMTRWAVHLRP